MTWYGLLDIVILWNLRPYKYSLHQLSYHSLQFCTLSSFALLYVSHITVRDKVRVVKVVRGNSSKRVKGIEIWLMSIFKIF